MGWNNPEQPMALVCGGWSARLNGARLPAMAEISRPLIVPAGATGRCPRRQCQTCYLWLQWSSLRGRQLNVACLSSVVPSAEWFYRTFGGKSCSAPERRMLMSSGSFIVWPQWVIGVLRSHLRPNMSRFFLTTFTQWKRFVQPLQVWQIFIQVDLQWRFFFLIVSLLLTQSKMATGNVSMVTVIVAITEVVNVLCCLLAQFCWYHHTTFLHFVFLQIHILFPVAALQFKSPGVTRDLGQVHTSLV